MTAVTDEERAVARKQLRRMVAGMITAARDLQVATDQLGFWRYTFGWPSRAMIDAYTAYDAAAHALAVNSASFVDNELDHAAGVLATALAFQRSLLIEWPALRRWTGDNRTVQPEGLR